MRAADTALIRPSPSRRSASRGFTFALSLWKQLSIYGLSELRNEPGKWMMGVTNPCPARYREAVPRTLANLQ